MTDRAPDRFTLQGRAPLLHWTILIAATILFVGLLELIHLRAALLLGAMAAAILVGAYEGDVALPRMPYAFAQAIIGCLVARSIDPGIFSEILNQWPVFLFSIASVIVASTALGALLARWKVLPGSTAIWGSAPGAASVMALMSGAYGGDIRLVAFMQFLRVVFVAIAASAVARYWVPAVAGAADTIVWFPKVALAPLAATIAIALAGVVAGSVFKIRAGSLLIPLFLGVVLNTSHLVSIALPPWLLAICYIIIGWGIGLRFTMDIVMHAARSFLKVSASILVLIAICGGLACIVHLMTGLDPLTSYLATSPGGIDSIAIIAASTHVDLPFIMAMQTGRFMVVLLIGPALARTVSRWTGDSGAECNDV
ncbi:MAG: AbrB family transcriptional regulator [Xanthobacteraceae bacterium]|nr:AbrB family transcriptional regulator [Xanthobacteraceae bacterium]